MVSDDGCLPGELTIWNQKKPEGHGRIGNTSGTQGGFGTAHSAGSFPGKPYAG